MTSAGRPVRVLHVLGALNRGGVETWLMHLLRRFDRREVAMDFLVHTEEPAAYDDEAKSLGARIFPCADPRKPLAYARRFRAILRERGPYEVVHSHVHRFSGYVLRVAAGAGVPCRIAHAHTDDGDGLEGAGGVRRSYVRLMKRWIARYATCGLAASRASARSLFGAKWTLDRRVLVLPCGIDLEPFREAHDRGALRAELGIPDDVMVLAHVGGFRPEKNHGWLVDIAAELEAEGTEFRLLLVGSGPRMPDIEDRVRRQGLSPRFLFLGERTDVPRVLAAADVFVFPSIREGFGMALVEAQAAGLQAVVSAAIPEETIAIPDLVRRAGHDATASDWARAIREAARDAKPERTLCLTSIASGAADVEVSARRLLETYRASIA